MQRVLFISFFVLLLGFVPCYSQPVPKQLPVFKLVEAKVDQATLKDIAKKLRMTGEIKQKGDRLVMVTGTRVLELSLNSGAIWYAEKAELWNTKLTPNLPSVEKAKDLAEEYFLKRKLQPDPGPHARFDIDVIGQTHLSRYETRTKELAERKLDIQVIRRLKVKAFERSDQTFPIIGGGGEVSVTFGGNEKLIGYQSVWRQIEKKMDKMYDVIPPEIADTRFKNMKRRNKVVSSDYYLAYYAGPPSMKQRYLYPVYVFSSEMRGSDEVSFPAKMITVPATDFEFEELPQPPPPAPPTDPPVVDVQRRRDPKNPLAPKPGTTDPEVKPEQQLYEAGTSWLGGADGLPNSESNAKGFVEALEEDNWTINFDWGDQDAWEDDWNSDDDNWVDAADFVFFSGHAEMKKFLLWARDQDDPLSDGTLEASEISPPTDSDGDMWGKQDVEWIILSSCGPLQNKGLNGPKGGNAAQRWSGAFDGLHVLLGYASVVLDVRNEGTDVVRYLKEGETIIHAWLRAADDNQDPTNVRPDPNGPNKYSGALYVEQANGSSTEFDHIWGYGPVGDDPKPPDVIYGIWTPT